MQHSHHYTTYIVECADGTLYSGITTDTERRVAEHNSSTKGAKYTKSRRPVHLKYAELFTTRSEAQKREHVLKSLPRLEKLALIHTYSKALKIKKI
jgi:putative endonuclease